MKRITFGPLIITLVTGAFVADGLRSSTIAAPRPSQPIAGGNSGNLVAPTSTSTFTKILTTPSQASESGGSFAPASLDGDASEERYAIWGGVAP